MGALVRLLKESEMKLPEGWKLVPVEPAEEMCRAAESCKYASSSKPWLGGYTPENVEGIYKTMLAVAPTPPAQEDEPVAYLVNSGGRERLSFYPLNGRWEHIPLYIHPANDELRRAAEETLSIIEELAKRSSLGMFNGKDVWTLSINLRAALGVK
jgi:hypothetical protein